ncbi:efflux RND transporter permease subunit [Rubellicoccus peritrichatus]|uniref:Efflux RND transporter permease subunit n=1 Tax=Rubellicoccus peritrichatus TaxID=3080537 RepID=A0AAQ3L9G4_9BACT|nr:efflux RND transporter permease subunit [Puniceicoccus sp. CR14]WOO39298.1 efflux RND transporter permease subunit [Puniceicoccus sp. CR14]
MIALLLKRPLLILSCIALATIALGWAASRLQVDNTPEAWLPANLSKLDDYYQFKDRFGDDSLIVVFTDQALIEEEAWRANFEKFSEALLDLSGIASIEAPDFDPEIGQPSIRSPLAPYLFNKENNYAAIVLFPEDSLDVAQRSQLINELQDTLIPWEAQIGTLKIAGADVITHDLDLGSQQSLGGLSPLVFTLMCGILLVATRSWRAVIVGLLIVSVVSIMSLGIFALADRTLNLVVVTMPAILAVVTVAQFMHLFSRFQSIETNNSKTELDKSMRHGWWRQAIAATWKPCMLSAVTTAAGFAALGFSEIPPVYNLGTFTAIGVILSFLLTFSLGPILLSLSSKVCPRPQTQRWWTNTRVNSISTWLQQHATAILLVAIVGTIVCGLGLRKLTVESNILTFFPPDHRVPLNYHEFEDNLLGLSTFELILEGDRDQVFSEQTLTALELFLEQSIQEEPLLQQGLSPLLRPSPDDHGDLQLIMPATILAHSIPENPADLPEELNASLWVQDNQVVLRTTLAAQTDSSNACHDLAERLRERIATAFPAGISATLTGSATLLIEGQVLLLDTQIRSFGIAFLIVTLVIIAAFRSVRLVTISLLPNLLPVVMTLGLMGLLAIPLNTATVTVAGIALGLIVDDTIHFLHQYREGRKLGKSALLAIRQTLFHVGRPIIITSLAVAIGFGAFAFTPFRPTLYFGLLIAVTAITAVICDLIVLPALLLWRKEKNS